MDRTAAYVADMLDAAQELFINLGEAAKRMNADRAAQIANVPWSRVIGLRNILAHGYEQVEHEVLYKTVRTELPPLISALESWLASQPEA